jgi:hypothetical protein
MQAGSAGACLQERYPSLRSAALSAPLKLLHSVLHDIATSLAFQAACTSASQLEWSTSSSWRKGLHRSADVKQLVRGLRVGYWLAVPLLCPHDAVAAAGSSESKGSGATQQGVTSDEASEITAVATGCAAVEVGIRDGSLVVACDPPLQELWRVGCVAEIAGVPCPEEPRLLLESGDLDGVLMVCSTSQLCTMLFLSMVASQSNVVCQKVQNPMCWFEHT